ncbi:MAG: hypothetical protein HFI34_12475 [Lachnospiraceae bacterium]|nr:hypothetical protein [Lachnospiraceae bacterium]
MLAILLIEMEWLKENRTLNGAIQRQKYYEPVRIEDGVNLSGNGIFLKKCSYYQYGNSVLSEQKSSDRLDKQLYEEGLGKAFTATDEREQRLAGLRIKRIQKNRGTFYNIEDINIPCITICEEPENRYRIKWFDSGEGMPRRKGGNEDLYKKGLRFAGQPNRLNETAFVLEEGKAGLLKYNYRYMSYHGQWYKCYYVYAVNDNLSQDIFIRTYDFEYNQMADLF